MSQDLSDSEPGVIRSSEHQNERRQMVQEEKIALELTRQELQALEDSMPEKLAALENTQVTDTILDQARVDTEAARVSEQGLQLGVTTTRRDIAELEQVISRLEARELILRNPAKGETDGFRRVEELERTRNFITQRKADLELDRKHLANLLENSELAAWRLKLAERWQSRVEALYRLQQEQNRLEAEEDLVGRLRKEQQSYVDLAAELSRQLEQERDTLSQVGIRLLETKIQDAQERVTLIQIKVRLAAIRNDLARLEELAAQKDPSSKALERGLDRVRGLRDELRDADKLLRDKLALFQQQRALITRREGLVAADGRLSDEEVQIVDGLIGAISKTQEEIQSDLAEADAVKVLLETYYEESVKKDLLVRKELPRTADEWQKLLEICAGVPRVLLHQVILSVAAALTVMFDSSALRWMALAALQLGVVWLIIAARRRLGRTIDRLRERPDSSFILTIILTVLQLVRKNLLGVGVASALLVAVFFFQVPQPGLGIIVALILLWVGIKTPINLAWLLLASPGLPTEQQRPRLYREVFWVLLIGGILAAVTILVHFSGFPDEVVGLFDRVFMVFLLISILPILRIRRLLVDLLAEQYAERFWFVSMRLISLFMPLAMFGAGLLGVVGYLNLAWNVAWHLLVFVGAMVGWQVIRGLVNDLVVVLKNYAVTHSGYGLLWTQDVINPLHRILDVLLFLAAFWVLFALYDLDTQSVVVENISAVIKWPLFTLASAEIDLEDVLLVIVVFSVILWFGQWGRSVTYRWIFSRIGDLGVRHSLSVFTQYFIVLIGFLAILNMLGLDLTTLTVFAGALGVGIGLGMQDMAKNFISGLLLLIERPLRSGDTVQIGTNVGEVSRIGIRSLTMKTWDNMEVIIPNADVISNAFTNWTHSDNVVRTVLMVGARFDANPHRVKQVIDQVLERHPSVLRDPKWAALFWEFGDSAVTFRVQYFTDFFRSNILEVHDEVIFGIWDGFKEAGIGVPYPQQDLRIKEWPADGINWRRLKEPLGPPQLEKPASAVGKASSG